MVEWEVSILAIRGVVSLALTMFALALIVGLQMTLLML